MRGMTNIETNEHKTNTFFLASIRKIELLIPILQNNQGKIRDFFFYIKCSFMKYPRNHTMFY